MTPIITYLGTDFRRRFAETLPPCAGTLSSDVQTLADWCDTVRGTVVTGAPENEEKLHDLHLIVAQTTIINTLLREQGFSPPDTVQIYQRASDTAGSVSAHAVTDAAGRASSSSPASADARRALH